MSKEKLIAKIQELNDAEESLKAVKKWLRDEEKITDGDYAQLKSAKKEISDQMKEIERDHMEELLEGKEYQEMRESKLDLEEKAANLIAEVYEIVDQMPVDLDIIKAEIDGIPTTIQIVPTKKLYAGGKEKKRRV